jgi:hypothetical protein
VFNAQEQHIVYVKPEDLVKAKDLIKDALAKLEAAQIEKKAVKRKSPSRLTKKLRKKEPPPALPIIPSKKKVASTKGESLKKEASDVS